MTPGKGSDGMIGPVNRIAGSSPALPTSCFATICLTLRNEHREAERWVAPRKDGGFGDIAQW
ncbi:MAG: hypothetical protein LLG05_08435 [Porphyromonadaceae bacterium]|nr:hypothetical protein [Porphyromonadaceae bacterium]